ncbi:glycosyl transferase [Mycolicibacterium sp. P9-64]|uniref:ArnT family glycosyltransferase n=1 Tax=Mycolicibacterium sp. P9-64 TaxID=2024612 RepID=UPI0011F04246|nr:glycosyltransferase family 39 protein [Mycolicibacterium sp. P9-64]KAA0082391.1 glycosyl transferase [Mycolicibacterium sp. P9-64]
MTRSRWTLTALLIGSAVLYVWDLGAQGWANAFYSAAAQAGSQSWKAFLFGSSDAANSITVDKPPMSLWPMALSVRVFGLNPWSILVPQALAGVATVALVWDAVRRRFGDVAAPIAGVVFALTPVVVVIFRHNNPDALFVLLAVAALWAALRAVDDGRTRWLVLCGVLIGCGYLTKQLLVVVMLPALLVPYLVAGPPSWLRRLGQVVLSLVVAVAASGWWVALVQLWPADDRPWIGGSQHNSELELTFGYNGFGRLNGHEVGAVGVPADTSVPLSHGPDGPGVGRLFQESQIGQIGWLLPAATVFLAVLLVWRWRAPRRDAQRASVLAWGLWLICAAGVLSFMAGIFHAYYTVILGPPIAALVGIGVAVCWEHRVEGWARAALAAAGVATAATGHAVLHHVPHYQPWLRWVLLAAAVVLLGWLLQVDAPWARRRGVHSAVWATLAVLALAGPLAYAVTTVSLRASAAIPAAGPPSQLAAAHSATADIKRAEGAPPIVAGGCSLLTAGTPPAEVVARLEVDADRFTWVAATVGSTCAAGYQLATQKPVMSLGGFNGSDPSPTRKRFEQLVAAHAIHYFIAMTGDHRTDYRFGQHLLDSGKIQQWVQMHFAPIVMGGVTIYDLTAPPTN